MHGMQTYIPLGKLYGRWGGGAGADLAFFPRGGGFDPSSTSRRSGEADLFIFFLRAAKRRADFFGGAILRAAKRRADFFGAILRAAKWRADFFGYFRRADFFWLFYEPRSGEPIFFGYFEPP